AYALQDRGLDTVEANLQLGFPADLRDYGIGAQILCDLGVRELLLLTNNPRKIVGLEAYGLTIARRVPLEMPSNAANRNYLVTKRDTGPHLPPLPQPPPPRRTGPWGPGPPPPPRHARREARQSAAARPGHGGGAFPGGGGEPLQRRLRRAHDRERA